jgi:ParB family chromosome partitioning protein
MSEAAVASTKELKVTDRGIEAPLSLLSVQKGFNVREDTKPDEEFLKSVKEHGVLRPIHVRNDPENEGAYLIVDGERRFNAATKLGHKTIPVIPEGEMDDTAALVLSLVSNEGHRTLTPRETANAFSRLKEAGVEEKEIARVMGFELRKVKETLRVLEKGDDELIEAVKAEKKKERIPPRAAARAADLPKEVQKKVAKEMKGKNVKEGLKVVRREEKKLGAKKRGRKAVDYELAPNVKKTCMLLESAVRAKLKKEPSNQRGKAHLEVINVLKGKLEITELYPNMITEIKEGKGAKKGKPSPKMKLNIKKGKAAKKPAKKVAKKKAVLKKK